MENLSNSEILNRMQKVAGVRSAKALADFLGVPSSTLSTWKNKTAIPLDVIVSFSQRVSCNLEWLITGEEKKELDEMETELLTRFKRLDFSQKLQVFNQLGGGQTNGVTQTSGDHGINVGGNVAIGK